MAESRRRGQSKRRRPRHWKGATVNPPARPPKPPGRWVDEDECHVCGERYRDFRSGVDWAEAAAMLRREAGPGGGYRSRGPVLWRMRILKLASWYGRHYPCGQYEGMGIPPAAVHACLHGTTCEALDRYLQEDEEEEVYEPDPELGF